MVSWNVYLVGRSDGCTRPNDNGFTAVDCESYSLLRNHVQSMISSRNSSFAVSIPSPVILVRMTDI